MDNNEIDYKIAKSLGITGDHISWTQNPVYAWSLMINKRIGLKPAKDGKWLAFSNHGVWSHVDEDPCIAICIAYLKEVANHE